MRFRSLILAGLLLLSVPASGLNLSVLLFRNSFTAGERVGCAVHVLNPDSTDATNYTGWIRLSATDPSLRVRGKNPDGSDLDFHGTGDILIGSGVSGELFLSTFSPGPVSLTAGEYMQNASAPALPATVSFSAAPLKRDLLLNEIMFKTVSSNYPYIELYNDSEATADLSGVSVFRYKLSSSGNTTNRQLLCSIPAGPTLAPGEFFVITKDRDSLLDIFPGDTNFFKDAYVRNPDGNSHGLLLTRGATNLDAVDYSSDLTVENVSIERSSPLQDASWSASLAPSRILATFKGTPGVPNSDRISPGPRNGPLLKLSSDNRSLAPGSETFVRFSSDTPGLVSVSLLDSTARPVAEIFPESEIGAGYEYSAVLRASRPDAAVLVPGLYLVRLRFINPTLGVTLVRGLIVAIGWTR